MTDGGTQALDVIWKDDGDVGSTCRCKHRWTIKTEWRGGGERDMAQYSVLPLVIPVMLITTEPQPGHRLLKQVSIKFSAALNFSCLSFLGFPGEEGRSSCLDSCGCGLIL